MTADEIKKLADLARAATPGEWRHHGASVFGNTAGLDHVAECRAHRDVYDAKYIAAISPTVLLSLLAKLAAVEAARDELADIAERATAPEYVDDHAHIEQLRKAGK